VSATLSLAVCLVSPLIFAATVWMTRAGGRRATGALAGGVTAAVLFVAWDALAAQQGWWSYAFSEDLLAALALAMSVAFVFGASAGLIGWRMMRAMGWTGVATFFAGFVGLGVLRDYVLAANTTLFLFGDGPVPQIMGAVGYLALALTVQTTMLMAAGPPRRDALRAGES
jgi:hypothetical protein